jgi:tetrahydromethanopterin S-methyltransferase subunit G
MIDCEQEAVSIVWEYVSEKDIPEINERLDKLNKEGK